MTPIVPEISPLADASVEISSVVPANALLHAHILRSPRGDEEPAMTTTPSAVIPGCAARRRPGIHNHSLGLWIPGSPLARRPGMTAERIIVPEMCASLSVFAGTTSLLWRDWLFSLQRTYLSADLTLRRAGTLRALSAPLLARASAKRSTIWWMMPRCFSDDGDCDEGCEGCWPRRAGGEIFSNENAGMTSPVVGFERALDSPRPRSIKPI